jgi:hypothetical protein
MLHTRIPKVIHGPVDNFRPEATLSPNHHAARLLRLTRLWMFSPCSRMVNAVLYLK